MAIKSKLRINQIQEGIADIDASMLPANVQTAAPALDSEAAGSLEETLIKMMRNDQRRFGSSAKPGFDQTADIGVIAHFSATDAADVKIETEGAAQKFEAIVNATHKLSIDKANDAASLAADDVNLLLDGANSAFSVGVEGQNDGLSIDKASNSAMLVSNTNYSVELDSSVSGSEYGEFKVNTSSMKIIEAKEARLEVAADSRLFIDDVAKAATLQQGTYELQLDETNTEGHMYIGDVKIDLDDTAAKEIRMTTGASSSIKLDEATQYNVTIDANNSQDHVDGEFAVAAQNGAIELSESTTSALVRTQNSKLEIVEAKTGELQVDANYGVKFDAQVAAQTMVAQANASKLTLDHLNAKARMETSTSFSEIIEDDIITHQVDANYAAKLDKSNEESSLKAAASSLVMSGVAGSEELTLQAAANEKLFLDAGLKARLQSNTTFLEMTQTGMAEIVTAVGHKIQIDKSTGGAEMILVDSMKDIEINAVADFKGVAGGKYEAFASDIMLHQVGGNKNLTLEDAGSDFKMYFEADSTASSTDVFSGARTGTYVSLETSGDYQRNIAKTEMVKIGMRQDTEIDEGQKTEFSKDLAANQQSDVFAGNVLSASNAGTEVGASFRVAAEKLAGEQHVMFGAGSAESAALAADGNYSLARYDIGAGITLETTKSYDLKASGSGKIDVGTTLELLAAGYGKLHSEGLELKATGAARASVPANYGVNDMNSLSLAAAGDEVWFVDAHKPASWSEARGVPLAVASEEWEQFEDAYGEVSLIGALVAAGQGGQDSFSHQIDITGAIASGSDVYSSANITATNIDGSAATVPAIVSGSTSLDELKARVEVYVNGQRLQLGAGRDFAVSIEDRSGTGGNAREFALTLEFALESADVVSVIVK